MIQRYRKTAPFLIGETGRYLARLLIAGLRAAGLAVFAAKPHHIYVPDEFGKSAHKHINIKAIPIFSEVAQMVIGHGRTSMYYDRLYTIFQALSHIKQRARCDSVHIAEIGVYRGGTSYFISAVANALDLPFWLHLFDTFDGHAAEDIRPELDADQKAGLFRNTSIEDVQQYLSCFENLSIYQGRFQECAHLIAEHRFWFIHLDVDIYEPTSFALKFLGPRLEQGAIVVVDDYGFATCSGVKRAVDEFAAVNPQYFALHLLTGQCVLIRHGAGGEESNGKL